MERDLIDVKVVASMLGGMNHVHVRHTVIKRPDFPRPFRISGRIFFDRPEIAEWIELQRSPQKSRK